MRPFTVLPLLALLAGSVLLSCPPAGAAPAPPAYLRLLEPLGRAYAADFEIPFTRVEAEVAAKITAADRAKWAAEVEKALSVGVIRKGKPLQVVALSAAGRALQVQMAGKRTPAQVVRGLVVPGNTLVRANWHFGAGKAVRSYSVFSPRGEILFDSLLSLPAVPAVPEH